MYTLLQNAFKGHVFPQVRTISLPGYAHHILSRCPGVRKVICIGQMDSSILASAIAKRCKKVEEVQGFRGSMESMPLIYSGKSAPINNLSLRTCESSTESTFDKIRLPYPTSWFPSLKPKMPGLNLSFWSDFQHPSSLKKLTHIKLISNQAAEEQAMVDVELCIKLAKDIVRKAQGQRSVIVEYYDARWGIDLSPVPEWPRALEFELSWAALDWDTPPGQVCHGVCNFEQACHESWEADYKHCILRLYSLDSIPPKCH